MALEFHFTDTPPQGYLDELHSLDVPKLYDPLLSKQQRGNLMVLIKKRLNDWHKKIRTQLKAIEGRYDSSNRDKARLIAAPYKTLEDLGNDLSTAVIELERSMRAGRVVPQGFSFGTHIFGELQRGEWHLGDSDDVYLWEDYTTLRRRMEAVGSEYKPLLENVKVSKARVKQQQNDIKAMMASYKRRKSPLNIIIRLLPVLLVVIFTLTMALYTLGSDEALAEALSNQAIGSILLLVATVAAILMIVLVRRRTRHLKELKENITQGKHFLQDLKGAYKQARIDYYPTDKLYKELRAEYKILKASFPS
ncbi:MAG: hypothetical protein Q9P01_12735 [Anaerolineae bacterium]|nr:hypothetical protein [Anaerolineae bacterium]MDQ7035659.1 hypothetical protein [Anaerolineae bacterium]